MAYVLLHPFEKGMSTTTIKGYRSSLSALMASRSIANSHNSDLGSFVNKMVHIRETNLSPRAMVVLR
jgi:hypothetical protein